MSAPVQLHIGHFVYLHVGHHVQLHTGNFFIGHHVLHHVSNHNAVSTLCEVSETLTEWKSGSMPNLRTDGPG